MSQSTLIFAGVFFAFFVFITAKGELPLYLSFFGVGGVKGAKPSSSSSGSGGGSTAALGAVAGAAK